MTPKRPAPAPGSRPGWPKWRGEGRQSMNATLTPTEATTLPSPACGGGEFATLAFLQMIERAARDPSIDIDKLDRLLLMRERENSRIAEQTFNAAMAAAQAEMEPIRFDSSNDQTRSRYASYAALDRT